ncbi:site-specific integrase [Bacteriovoracaceae bacterium]|nr:site-specific integrase [Bacteriovoracaceae bacterium]
MQNFTVKIHSLQNGNYQSDYVCPIDKRRKRKTFKNKKEAKEHKNRLEVKFHQKDMSYFLELPIGQLIEYHLKRCPESKLNQRGVPFRDFYETFSRHKLYEINTTKLREWFEVLRIKHDYSEKSLHATKICLTHFFRFLVEEEIMASNPLKPIVFKKRVAPKRPRIYFSKEEIKEILEKAKDWSKKDHYTDYFYPFLYTLVQTGARRGEILKLKWRDVDFKLNSITFRDTKVHDDRSIIMSKGLRELIESLPRHGEHVFTKEDGTPLEANMPSRHLVLFKNEFSMIGHKKDWGFHSLRHSFAYNYLKRGGSMYQLQAILGHYNITSTVNTYGRIKASDDEMPSPYDF